MHQHWGVPPADLPAGHPGWDLEARSLARGCVNLLYTTSPRKILLGSGVAMAAGLCGAVNRHVAAFMGGFPTSLVRQYSAAERPVERAALAPESSLWDANEQKDVAATHPDVVATLRTAAETTSPFSDGPEGRAATPDDRLPEPGPLRRR